MATGKRYYWMKLKDTFMTSDVIDYFMSQPNGANYVVLYQMLCLKTINTGGRLSRTIGEIIIPYDAEKIQRDCKWFSIDTVRVALKLYAAAGLIYQDQEGVLVLTDHENLVGSETDYSAQKRSQRRMSGRFQPSIPEKTGAENVDTGADNAVDNVHTDIDIRDRDKEIDIRDIDIDKTIDINSKNKNGAKASAFDHEHKAYLLADFLSKQIRKRLKLDKSESVLQKWADAFDKCNRIDNHPWEEISKVLQFSQRDSFWQANILSGKKFREKYDQLLAKMKSAQQAPRNKQSTTASALSILQELHEEEQQ